MLGKRARVCERETIPSCKRDTCRERKHGYQSTSWAPYRCTDEYLAFSGCTFVRCGVCRRGCYDAFSSAAMSNLTILSRASPGQHPVYWVMRLFLVTVTRLSVHNVQLVP